MAEAQRWRGACAATLGPATEARGLLTEGEEAFYRVLGCAIVAAGQTKDQSALERCLALLVATPPSDAAAAQLKLIALCRARTSGWSSGACGRRRPAEPRADAGAHAAGRRPCGGGLAAHHPRGARALRRRLRGYVQETERAVQAHDRGATCGMREISACAGLGPAEMGEFERAVTVLRRAVDESAELGVPLVEGYALQNPGLAYCRVGSWGWRTPRSATRSR
ncbi:MAG: hypothetical protein IPH72_28215 [Sandaracinaceae bacterium]|nr:hypothetical protein [Sandaracinaceae bacterium]